MSLFEQIKRDLIETIRTADKKKTSAYDTQAEVIRVEGDTAWVHIPGGVDETPIRKTVNATAGDTVQVRVSGGKAWITGNATAPPTDDTYAKAVEDNIVKNYVTAANIDAGFISATSVAAGAYVDVPVSFNKQFATTPIVVASFYSESTGYGFGSCTLSTLKRTSTGCTIRIFNNDSTTRVPALTWIAIGA